LNESKSNVGIEVARSLAECLISVGHPSRLKIVEYCSEKPHRFTDIILDLRLNPASFKFHARVLIDSGLIRKVERGVYETTELGKLLIELVRQAERFLD
jgi:predicted transcriptional regulator